jgi:ATP-binding cassette subfamily B protein
VRVFDDIRPLRDGARVLARLLPEVDRGRTAAVVLAACVVACAQVSSGVVTGVLIGRVSDGVPVEGGTVVLVVLLPTLLLLGEGARLVGSTVGQTLKRRVDGSLRRRVLAVSLGPPGIAHLEDPELLSLQGAARNLSPFSFTPGDAAVELTSGMAVRLQPVLAALVLAWFEPTLAVLALVVWFVAHVMFVKATVRLVMGAALTMSSPEVVYLRDLVQGPEAAKEVRVFGLGGWLGGRFLDLTRQRMALSLAQRTGDLRSYLRAGSVLGLGLVAGLLWVGVAATRSQLDATAAAVCVFALLGVFSVPNLFPDVPVMFGTFSVGAVEAAERARRERPEVVAPLAGEAPAPAVVDGIRFRDVTFAYPSGGDPVIEHLDLFIPAGQRLAVVGLNGAGKTTMVKLLCRLYDPDAGRIEVDGVDLASVAADAWRRRVGVLFQDFVRWQLPLDDNVCLRPGGGMAASPTGSAEAAAARAGLAPLVDELPNGWATILSPSARGGVDLSGGQWQRVALARGLHAVETGASVLVLDEPTANLDPRAELEFYESVLRGPLGSGRPVTTILISHRFATVRHADRIVVVDGGRIVEDGTHDELVAAEGRYHDLFESQARTYAEASDG